MNEHNVTQGSPDWLALRAKYFTASEAPAMMGVSPYMTRTELMQQKHTGLVPEVASGTQRIFDRGHAAEATARQIAEGFLVEDLYPVTGSLEVDSLPLLASFDGLTMDGGTVWEHKLWNVQTAQHIDVHGEPPMHHVWQLEQQLLVSGAQRAVFTTSDGAQDNCCHCEYTSVPERRAALIAGWKQFAQDLATYVPSVAEVAKPTGNAPETLPALHIEVTGMVTASNLDAFKATALEAIRGVNRALSTDQHFADAEKAVKWCADVEERLAAAKAHALSQTASIDALFKTIDDIAAEAKRVRLDLSKLVTSRKDELRAQVVSDAQKLLAAHVAALDQRIGKPLMHKIPADFAGAIKGKRSLDSINDAVAVELARTKIAANEAADRVQINLSSIEAAGMPLLFADLAALVHKAPDDLAAVIDSRTAKAKADEAARAEQARQQKAAIAAAESAIKAAKEQAPAPAAPPVAVVATPAPLVQEVAPPVEQRVAPPVQAPEPAGPLLKLGDINACISPLSITAAGLAELGFVPVRQDGTSKLYRASDFCRMCHAMMQHLSTASMPATI